MAISIEPLPTAAARRHIRAMLREIAPASARLERKFRAALRRLASHASGLNAEAEDALNTITPAAASRCRSVSSFLDRANRAGRELAQRNFPPEEVEAALDAFDELLSPLLNGRFQPAREQLRLATVLSLNSAYYQVREAEAQTFFGLCRSEAESSGVEELLRGFARTLARAFGARTVRVVMTAAPESEGKGKPEYRERPHAKAWSPGCVSYWRYPIHATASFQFGFRTRRPWLPRELSVLEAAAVRCREAMEGSRLRDEVRRLEAESRRAEEDERRRIGRDLHDEAGQSLLLLRLKLEMMERAAPEALLPGLREARETAEKTVGELRRIVAALSPSVLERLGLRTALRRLVERFRGMHGAEVDLRLPAREIDLGRQTEETIYRAAQECLQNAARHSQATRVKVSLRIADTKVKLSVADDGAGFDADLSKNKPMSFGLAGMRERAALLGGSLAVRSSPGKGAGVTLELPRGSALVTKHV